MTTRTFHHIVSSMMLLGPISLGCSGSSETTVIGVGGAAGTSTGTSSAAGGIIVTGGTVPANGGSAQGGGQGSSVSTGGASMSTGGASMSTGGASTSTGGKASGGASTSTGGKASGGASTSTGGKASGGASTSTGGKASGGASTSTGGKASGGASTSTGGKASGGASTSTGGKASGGASTSTGGASTSTCTTADLEVCASYKVGTHCGLTYEIWTDSSSSCMTNTSYGFKAVWDTGDLNYLARKGVRPGSTNPVVTYSANYQPSGNSYLAIYGWTTNPLIEYYIVDSWGTWRPPGTAVIGTVTADGGTYDIYRSERVNMPSIEGTKTFWQYWSVRTVKRTSGTITVAPHFAAWAAFGLTLGTFYEVSLVVEGYHSSGTADVTVSFK